MTAGRAARLGILIACLAAALSARWAFTSLAPAFQSAIEGGSASEARAAIILDRRFHPSVLRWDSHIGRWSHSFDLDPILIATVMQIESCGNPTARSQAGAIGLFQVMPYHFEAGEDPYDPETNALRGLAYLKSALELSSGDTALALAGYNGGHSQIDRPQSTWPAETQRYVAWGMGLMGDLGQASAFSPTLQAWLGAGGDGLCRRATEVHLAQRSRPDS